VWVCTISEDGGREYVLLLFVSAGVWDFGEMGFVSTGKIWEERGSIARSASCV
jgi:hypothetical protein